MRNVEIERERLKKEAAMGMSCECGRPADHENMPDCYMDDNGENHRQYRGINMTKLEETGEAVLSGSAYEDSDRGPTSAEDDNEPCKAMTRQTRHCYMFEGHVVVWVNEQSVGSDVFENDMVTTLSKKEGCVFAIAVLETLISELAVNDRDMLSISRTRRMLEKRIDDKHLPW
jgi:hypothetical protein